MEKREKERARDRPRRVSMSLTPRLSAGAASSSSGVGFLRPSLACGMRRGAEAASASSDAEERKERAKKEGDVENKQCLSFSLSFSPFFCILYSAQA